MAGQTPLSPQTRKWLYIFLGAAFLLIAAGLALRNLSGAKLPMEYMKAAGVAVVGLYFLIVRRRSR